MYRLGRKEKTDRRKHVDHVTLFIMVVAMLALFALIWYQVRPVKLLDIKVPVATDKASYYPSQEISGLFFGENYYKGPVKVLREVFCKDFKRAIKPPAESADGDFFATQVEPTVYEGASRKIGNLPEDIPIGSNCVLKFTNIYDLKTPFGTRHEVIEYYTQNFAIVTKERREQLDKEAEGQSPAANSQQNSVVPNAPQTAEQNTIATFPQEVPPSFQSAVPETAQNEPVTVPESCTIKLFGLCVRL